ncbi:MAG TPA: hypothetical protein VF681_01110 [Abditibacteriaceae bacterium]|jgi:hypothetical protein
MNLKRLFGKGDAPQAPASRFVAGQVCRYHTRDLEPDSTLIMCRVETVREETVIHISLRDVRVRVPNAPDGYSRVIGHMPIAEMALEASVTSCWKQMRRCPITSKAIVSGSRPKAAFGVCLLPNVWTQWKPRSTAKSTVEIDRTSGDFKGNCMNLLGLFGFQTASQRRRSFIETYEFSSGLKSRFAARKSLDAREQDLVFEALRNYFVVCHYAGILMVSMPSQIVDDAWHEFILFTRDYNDFCLQAFGRYLHHTPAEAMKTRTTAQKGIERAWRLSCEQEGINRKQPDRLPLLFAIDDLLHVENGFIYSLDCLSGIRNDNRNDYCATHISSSSGCGGSSGDSNDGRSDGGGCGGGGCGGGGD